MTPLEDVTRFLLDFAKARPLWFVGGLLVGLLLWLLFAPSGIWPGSY